VHRTTCCFALLVALVLAAAVNAQAARPRLEPPAVAALTPGSAASLRVRQPNGRRLAAVSWWGRTYDVTGGEAVKVFVSTAYPEDDAVAQAWADFFASLIHGHELGLLTAYISPLAEVQEICGADALGCYGANRLVMPGDSSGGIAAASIATHEYGHHVANNRLNPPWRAIDWGTKRWASSMNVCTRAAQGTAFPGDEGSAYMLNPGEAFAESYRVLNERERGLSFTWPIVDPSFIPDAGALQALREDVLNPWSGETTRTIRMRFAPGRRLWTLTLATPFDGRLTATARGSIDLQLADGDRNLARGAWTTSGVKRLEYQACGRRSVQLRVVRAGGPRTITLRVSQP
jgi:hypothetical protein